MFLVLGSFSFSFFLPTGKVSDLNAYTHIIKTSLDAIQVGLNCKHGEVLNSCEDDVLVLWSFAVPCESMLVIWPTGYIFQLKCHG
jgi:hypothetical protein